MFSDIVYGIIYMYITKYGCVLCSVAMDLIPILLGSLPLAHNAQHSLVIIYSLCGMWLAAAECGADWSHRVADLDSS